LVIANAAEELAVRTVAKASTYMFNRMLRKHRMRGHLKCAQRALKEVAPASAVTDASD
jgi:hypothetical protein